MAQEISAGRANDTLFTLNVTITFKGVYGNTTLLDTLTIISNEFPIESRCFHINTERKTQCSSWKCYESVSIEDCKHEERAKRGFPFPMNTSGMKSHEGGGCKGGMCFGWNSECWKKYGDGSVGKFGIICVEPAFTSPEKKDTREDGEATKKDDDSTVLSLFAQGGRA